MNLIIVKKIERKIILLQSNTPGERPSVCKKFLAVYYLVMRMRWFGNLNFGSFFSTRSHSLGFEFKIVFKNETKKILLLLIEKNKSILFPSPSCGNRGIETF